MKEDRVVLAGLDDNFIPEPDLVISMVEAFLPSIVIGLVSVTLLVGAAELVVSRVSALARYYDISEVVIAMTLVSIGTSLPELGLSLVGSFNIVSSIQSISLLQQVGLSDFLLQSHSSIIEALYSQSAMSESALQSSSEVFLSTSGTVLGANIGSNIIQITLILGIAIIAAFKLQKKGFDLSGKFLKRDYIPMIGSTVLLFVLSINWGFLSGGSSLAGTLTRFDGIILVTSFVLYIGFLYSTRSEKLYDPGDASASKKPMVDLLAATLGMLVVVGSAEVFLRVVEIWVSQTGISQSMIGIASVGLVAALPELITAVSGLRHGSEGVSLGTLIGSNITNPLLAVGSGAIISTYAVPKPLVIFDLPFLFSVSFLILVMAYSRKTLITALRRISSGRVSDRSTVSDKRIISVTAALILLVLYIFYIYARYSFFPVDF